MKIAIDIRPLMDRYYSGVSEYTLSLVSALLRSDKENEYTLFYNSFKDVSERIPKFENAKYLSTSYPLKLIDYFSFNFLNRPQIDKKAKAQVFIVPHINFIGLSGACSSLLTVHDLSFLRYPEFFNWRKNIWHWNLRVRSLVKRFGKIIAVSENTKRDIVEFLKVSESKVEVIYPGLNEQMLPISDEVILAKVREKYHLPERFILYLGTIEPRKNIEGLISAFEICRAEDNDLRLVLAGTFGWKSRSIKRAIANSKFQNPNVNSISKTK